MNYVEVDFIHKEMKEKTANNEISHYAEVVISSKPHSTEEVLYRLREDYKIDKLQTKAGDIFLSHGKEKNGLIDGVLIKICPKHNYHSNVAIPLDKLIAYRPVHSQPIKSSSPKVNPGYVDMNDRKSPNDELELLAGFYLVDQSPPPMPTLPSPSRDKVKVFPKQKISKLKASCKNSDKEVAIFAVCDRKSSSKEKEVLAFKQKQLGVLVFSSLSGWSLVKMQDETTVGWVPRNCWRILPESIEDDYSSCDYSPWLYLDVKATELEAKLKTTGEERNFFFLYDQLDKVYLLLLKYNTDVHKFRVNILPDKRLVFSGKYFTTLDNLVIYLKRVPFNVGGADCILGLPFKNE